MAKSLKSNQSKAFESKNALRKAFGDVPKFASGGSIRSYNPDYTPPPMVDQSRPAVDELGGVRAQIRASQQGFTPQDMQAANANARKFTALHGNSFGDNNTTFSPSGQPIYASKTSLVQPGAGVENPGGAFAAPRPGAAPTASITAKPSPSPMNSQAPGLTPAALPAASPLRQPVQVSGMEYGNLSRNTPASQQTGNPLTALGGMFSSGQRLAASAHAPRPAAPPPPPPDFGLPDEPPVSPVALAPTPGLRGYRETPPDELSDMTFADGGVVPKGAQYVAGGFVVNNSGNYPAKQGKDNQHIMAGGGEYIWPKETVDAMGGVGVMNAIVRATTGEEPGPIHNGSKLRQYAKAGEVPLPDLNWVEVNQAQTAAHNEANAARMAAERAASATPRAAAPGTINWVDPKKLAPVGNAVPNWTTAPGAAAPAEAVAAGAPAAKEGAFAKTGNALRNGASATVEGAKNWWAGMGKAYDPTSTVGKQLDKLPPALQPRGIGMKLLGGASKAAGVIAPVVGAGMTMSEGDEQAQKFEQSLQAPESSALSALNPVTSALARPLRFLQNTGRVVLGGMIPDSAVGDGGTRGAAASQPNQQPTPDPRAAAAAQQQGSNSALRPDSQPYGMAQIQQQRANIASLSNPEDYPSRTTHDGGASSYDREQQEYKDKRRASDYKDEIDFASKYRGRSAVAAIAGKYAADQERAGREAVAGSALRGDMAKAKMGYDATKYAADAGERYHNRTADLNYASALAKNQYDRFKSDREFGAGRQDAAFAQAEKAEKAYTDQLDRTFATGNKDNPIDVAGRNRAHQLVMGELGRVGVDLRALSAMHPEEIPELLRLAALETSKEQGRNTVKGALTTFISGRPWANARDLQGSRLRGMTPGVATDWYEDAYGRAQTAGEAGHGRIGNFPWSFGSTPENINEIIQKMKAQGGR